MTSTASASEPAGWLVTPLGRFAVRPGETLLATLLRTGHAVEYQCRSGYCGACRLKMAPSQRHAVLPVQTALASVGADEVLACCCRIAAAQELDLTAIPHLSTIDT